MFEFIRKFYRQLNTLKYIIYVRLRYPNFKIGKSLEIFGKLYLQVHKDSLIQIGEKVVFRSNTKSNFVGIYKPVSIAVYQKGQLKIGNNSGFSGTSIVVTQQVTIGNYCNFGGNTSIWDTDFHPAEYLARRDHSVCKIKSAPIIIGDDVFVGANSIILKGISIGNRSIIGAGSIVTKNIPADQVWGGNPARFIKKII
jgi:acetyltransferase-like isoleucine patch superfamily enzyme